MYIKICCLIMYIEFQHFVTHSPSPIYIRLQKRSANSFQRKSVQNEIWNDYLCLNKEAALKNGSFMHVRIINFISLKHGCCYPCCCDVPKRLPTSNSLWSVVCVVWTFKSTSSGSSFSFLSACFQYEFLVWNSVGGSVILCFPHCRSDRAFGLVCVQSWTKKHIWMEVWWLPLRRH